MGLLAALAGCERDLSPPLLEVSAIEPREVDTLDRLEIRGVGFPQGRRARVTFRGDVRRAGEPEVRGAAIEAEGVVASPDRVEVTVTEQLGDRFCGRDRATHATFAGSVEVAFASSAAGAPPLAAEKRNVTLDVRPSSVRADLAASRSQEAARFLAFLGLTTLPPTPRGIRVDRVAPGSPAERHGIVPGDLLSSLDGVRILEVTDLVPASSRKVELGLRHGDDAPSEDVRTVALTGFAGERIPSELAPALLVAGLALAVLLLLLLPGPALLVAAEVRVASRVRRTTSSELAQALFGSGSVAIVSAVASIMIGTFALGPHVLAPDLDGAVLVVTALGLLFVARLALARGRFAFLGSLARFAVPAALLLGALVGVVATTGAYRLSEIVDRQGAAPWAWTFAHDPGAAALGFVYVAALVAIARVRATGQEPTLSVAAPPATRAKRPAEVLERLGILLAATLGAAVFFGGWQLPRTAAPAPLGVVFLGGLLLVLKAWLLAGGVLATASLGVSWSWKDATSFCVRRLLPALILAAALASASRLLTLPQPVEAAFGATLVAMVTLLALRTTWRVRSALSRPEPHASPFL